MTQLQSDWNQTKKMLQNVNNNRPDMNRETALDDLAYRYRRFAILATVFTFIMPSLFLGHIFPGEWKLISYISFSVYFATAAAMDWWLFYGIRHIDIFDMPVTQVTRLALYYRKWHHRFMAILLPFAIALFSMFVLSLGGNTAALLGAITGGVVGLIIGLMHYRRFMRDYRCLSTDDC